MKPPPLKEQVLQRHSQALAIYGQDHFYRSLATVARPPIERRVLYNLIPSATPGWDPCAPRDGRE